MKLLLLSLRSPRLLDIRTSLLALPIAVVARSFGTRMSRNGETKRDISSPFMSQSRAPLVPMQVAIESGPVPARTISCISPGPSRQARGPPFLFARTALRRVDIETTRTLYDWAPRSRECHLQPELVHRPRPSLHDSQTLASAS